VKANDEAVTEPLAYYLLLECRHCDREIYYGVCVSLLEHNGLPVVGANQGTQTRFDCEHCGASNYTGELDVLVEGGRDLDDDDDEDDDFDEEDEDPEDVLAAFETGEPVVTARPETTS
jgi:hypothetical protein